MLSSSSALSEESQSFFKLIYTVHECVELESSSNPQAITMLQTLIIICWKRMLRGHITYLSEYIFPPPPPPLLPHHVEHSACRWSCKSRISIVTVHRVVSAALSSFHVFYDFNARVLLYHYKIHGSLPTVIFCYKDLKSMKSTTVVDHKNNQW